MPDSVKLAKGGRSMDPDGLSVKERQFVGRYLIHGEKHRAAREAGLDFIDVEGKRHRCSAWNWHKVKEVIDRELACRRERYKLESDWVLQQLAMMVRFDVRQIFNDDNSVKNIHDLDEATAAGIAGIEIEEEVKEIETKKGKTTRLVSRRFKYKMISRTETMLMAMKHLRLLGEASAPPPSVPPVLNVQFVNVNAPQLNPAPPVLEGEVA